MSRKWNFSAGPGTLPESVLEQIKEDLVDYKGAGLSIIESSHRAALYEEVHQDTINIIKELMKIPENYEVLFLGGGATLQFAMLPMNLLKPGQVADYIDSGAWAKKAISDAGILGKVRIMWDGSNNNYKGLPDPSSLIASPDSSYLHITSNETIGGIAWKTFPKTGNVPLVADMSSDIMSRPVNIEDFGVIYAGAQKNIGPAGVTLVIIRKDLVESSAEGLPAYLSYRNHADKKSMYNTPPVFSIYAVNKVMNWLKDNGGVEGIEIQNQLKADLLYRTIDESGGFYTSPVDKDSRSRMNVVFRLPSEELEQTFLTEAALAGMISMKGHRDVGGCRASLYNAMPFEGVEALTNFMKDFSNRQ